MIFFLKGLKTIFYHLSGFALEKLEMSTSKNPDFHSLIYDENPYDFKRKISYAPLVSVEVERVFSSTNKF